MNDEIRMPISLPLDTDGFLRRECPTCEGEFKWFSHQEGDQGAEVVGQYFCPLCGNGAGTDSWWTPAQLEYVKAASGPAIDQYIQDSVADAFKGVKGMKFKPNNTFSVGFDTPDAIVEPNDMMIAEPPCHPNEPIKVPEETASKIHCIVCGSPFTV